MNIKTFKVGDFVTRNEPLVYREGERGDSSWCGEKMQFLGIDEVAKVFYVKFCEGHFKSDEKPYQFSFARDAWDEGWTAFPTSLYESAVKFLKKN